MTCQRPGVRYPSHMMTREQHHETRHYDLDLPDACLACGGALSVRFSAGAARAVCLPCRRISSLEVERSEEGMRVVQLPAGAA